MKELGRIGLRDRPGRRGSGLDRLHPAQARGGRRGGSIASTDLKLPEDITQESARRRGRAAQRGRLRSTGSSSSSRCPDHLDEAQAVLAIDPVKDVDGVHPFNAGQLYLGRPTLVPATPLGIMALLDEYQIGLDGTRAVVIGRSDIVGKPIAHLLLQANATVTICHSHTDDLERHTLDADVLVVAAGSRRGSSRRTWSSPARRWWTSGSTAPRRASVGDVDPGAVAIARTSSTPVPGGVGPMTIAMLPRNTLRAARFRRGLLAFPEARALTFAPLHSRSAARCPGRRCLLYEGSTGFAQGHRQVVLEREGLRLHRARRRRRRLRPLLGDCRGWLQVADRGSAGRVRRRAGR